MAYVIGIVLALGVFAFARWTRFDRDRAFYPTVVVVVASYYVLFATMSGAEDALVVELIVMAVFVVVAVLGFRFNAWLVVAALAAHGLFDMVHGRFVANPGVPEWWPAFCLTFDVGAAGLLAFVLARRQTQSAPSSSSTASNGSARTTALPSRTPRSAHCPRRSSASTSSVCRSGSISQT